MARLADNPTPERSSVVANSLWRKLYYSRLPEAVETPIIEGIQDCGPRLDPPERLTTSYINSRAEDDHGRAIRDRMLESAYFQNEAGESVPYVRVDHGLPDLTESDSHRSQLGDLRINSHTGEVELFCGIWEPVQEIDRADTIKKLLLALEELKRPDIEIKKLRENSNPNIGDSADFENLI